MTYTIATDLAGNYSAGWAILAGIIGAMAMLVVIYGGRAMGMTSMDLLRTLGTMVQPRGSTNLVYGIGLMMHAMMGAAFGLVHAGLLHAFDPSSGGAGAGLGILIGAVHGVIVTGGMPTMLTMGHPLVKDGTVSAPGPAMTGFGKMTPMGMVLAHVVYGLVTGAIYVAAVG
ncbi:MAG: hypothetical protein ACE5GB_08850 [Acidimicrobiales bacterium]